MPDELDEQIATTVARGETYTLLLLWAGPHRDQEESERHRSSKAKVGVHLGSFRGEQRSPRVRGGARDVSPDRG